MPPWTPDPTADEPPGDTWSRLTDFPGDLARTTARFPTPASLSDINGVIKDVLILGVRWPELDGISAAAVLLLSGNEVAAARGRLDDVWTTQPASNETRIRFVEIGMRAPPARRGGLAPEEDWWGDERRSNNCFSSLTVELKA